jgi:DNA-directed RNA polymerase subunit RPC12/RpoP
MSYKCEKCNKIFPKKYNLTVHLKRIKPCNINNTIDLNINTNDDLNIINNNSNIKKLYTCINCGKNFN